MITVQLLTQLAQASTVWTQGPTMIATVLPDPDGGSQILLGHADMQFLAAELIAAAILRDIARQTRAMPNLCPAHREDLARIEEALDVLGRAGFPVTSKGPAN